MDERQLKQIGTDAENMLKSESFVKIVETLQQKYMAAFYSSKPEEKRMRDDLYLQNRALDDLIGEMVAVAQQAEAIRVRDTEEMNDE